MGAPFFTMELLKGLNLGELIKQIKENKSELVQAYPLSKRIEVFLKVCDAIAYAHSLNIVHLDLKPDNIYLDDFGQVIVCDWGLGKILHSDQEPENEQEDVHDPNLMNDLTLNGQVKGTPGYMAPEQFKPRLPKDQRTDIFSLGAMLFEWLTLEKAFSGKTFEELEQSTHNGVVNFEAYNLPQGIKAVLFKALQAKVEDRYQCINDLKDDIKNFLRASQLLQKMRASQLS